MSTSDILFCDIERLKQQQLMVFQRISQFSDRIKTAIQDSNAALIPNVVDTIYSYLSHQYFINLWLKVFHSLGQFSFMMKAGCDAQEIQQFESKCKKILQDKKYCIPDDIRISLMICNGIGMPSIFQSIERISANPYTGNPVLGSLPPLSTWTEPNDPFWEYITGIGQCQSDLDLYDIIIQKGWGDSTGNIRSICFIITRDLYA